MISLDRPVIVEGKYDKIRLSRVISTTILTTDGFGVFRAEEKKLLLQRLAAERGVIVLTDPDGAGLVIRNFLRGILKKEQITNLYVPAIPGKEKRKKTPSGEGLLGVEGMNEKTLEQLFLPFAADAAPRAYEPVPRIRFYEDGFSGGENAGEKRKKLAAAFGLPGNLSSGALLEAINLLGGLPAYESMINSWK